MADSGEVYNFFQKPIKNKNICKDKAAESSDDDDEEGSQPSSSIAQRSKKPILANNKLHFSTTHSSSKPSSNATGEDDDEGDEAAEGQASALFHFESSKENQVQHDSHATTVLETETELSKDAQAIRERVLKQAKEALKGKSKGDDKVYHGIHGYTASRTPSPPSSLTSPPPLLCP